MGSTKISSPETPAAPSVQSSMSDYIANYPALFNLQQQYAPQEAQMAVNLANQYAGQYGSAMKTAQESMYPEETKINNAMNQQVLSGINSEVPDWMKQQYQSELNANLGTNVGSGMGADYMSRGLLQQQQDWQNYYRNLGLSITGRQPIATANTPATTNQLANYTPQGVMNYNATNYGNYANAYADMYGTNQKMASQGTWWQSGLMNMAGQGLGGMASGIGYGMM